jgi:hypothetical protein
LNFDTIRSQDELDERAVVEKLDGFVITYQILDRQFVDRLLDLCRHRKVVLCLDELQLFSQDCPTASHLSRLAEGATFIVCLVGDLSRPDNKEVVLLDYEMRKEEEDKYNERNPRYAVANYSYSLSAMLNDKACINPDFIYSDGPVDVERGEADTLDEIDRWSGLLSEVPTKYASSALHTVLEGRIAEELLEKCIANLLAHRKGGRLPYGNPSRLILAYPNAKGLIVCQNIAHALYVEHLIAEKYPELVKHTVRVTSESTAAQADLALYRKKDNIFLCIAVAMPYIGMDLPALSHLLALTDYRSTEWLRQMLARAWRVNKEQPYNLQYVAVYAPRDPKWKKAIEKINEELINPALDPREGPPVPEGTGKATLVTARDFDLISEIEFDAISPGWLQEILALQPNESPEPQEQEEERAIAIALSAWRQAGLTEEWIASFSQRWFISKPHTIKIDTRSYDERCQELHATLRKELRRIAERMAARLGLARNILRKNGKGFAYPSLIYEVPAAILKKHVTAGLPKYKKNEDKLILALQKLATVERESQSVTINIERKTWRYAA